MKKRSDTPAVPLTPLMAAAVRVIMLTPLIDAAGVARECGGAASTLVELVNEGFAKVTTTNKRDGRATTLYSVTLKGMLALEAFVPAPAPEPAPAPATAPEPKRQPPARPATPAAPKLTGYSCPELGRTCLRPGAYDAFALPSMFGSERRNPRGVA